MGSCWSGDGGASWCIQLGRTAIHFPQLVIYGTAKQREAGVHGTGPPELVHCPAPSCFTTQRAGLPNLRWQTVTSITPRLANEDWWCLKGPYTQSVLPTCYTLHQGISSFLFLFLSFFVYLIFHASFFLFSLISIFLCCPLSQCVDIM